MSTVFGDFDVSRFWDNCDYARDNYVGETLTHELLASIEAELGYTLPGSYVELMMQQNGGTPVPTRHRTLEPTSWAEDHIAITGLYGINRSQMYALCGSTGSCFWIEEWGYPPIGVYFADCPSAGHDMLCLDYRKCGPTGEPQVVHVDQEPDYTIPFVAETFERFIRGLEPDAAFDSEDDTALDEGQVVSSWIDPALAKDAGWDVPEDGWIKRKPWWKFW